MTVLGINRTVNANGVTNTTLHVAEDFDSYYSNVEANRSCEGKKVSSIFVGDVDCSKLKVGMEIEIYFNKAITTTKGTFQTVKKIEVIK